MVEAVARDGLDDGLGWLSVSRRNVCVIPDREARWNPICNGIKNHSGILYHSRPRCRHTNKTLSFHLAVFSSRRLNSHFH
jgi:hypothetical protein